MRAKAATAAVASVPAALVAHALDVSGRLPFVHESGAVRNAMGPLAVVLWLALTALVVGIAAASRRPALLGAPAALVSAALPELIGRHDPGAIVEPGATLGALLQWLLLLTVLALALVADRVLRTQPLPGWIPSPVLTFTQSYRGRCPSQLLVWCRRPRGPPCSTFP